MPGLLTIRADAGPEMGTGHVMRMLALGQAWQDAGGAVRMVGCVEPGLLRERVHAEGIELLELDKPHPAPADLEMLLALTRPGQWVALDGYHLDTSYMRALRTAGRKTLVLDDINDRGVYEADILLNQNLGTKGFAYALNPDAQLLLGPRFALLRREFQRPGPAQGPVAKNAHRVLVTYGGADPADLCTRLMDALDELACPNLEVTFVAGAANPRFEALRERSQSLPGRCGVLRSVEDMAELMRQTDLAVGAAGSTCWELCVLGVPMMLTAVAENQQGVLTGLAGADVARAFAPQTEPRELALTLGSLLRDATARQNMREGGQGLVDGRGAWRVVRTMQGSAISLRPAQPRDEKTLLLWRNHPSVVAQSFTAGPVPPETHARWFADKLSDPDCLLFLAEQGPGTLVGQVRFDIEEELAVISICVAPEYQGQGLGTAMTRKACALLWTDRPGVVVQALVKPQNAASAAMFLSAGFRQVSARKDMAQPHLLFELKDSRHEY